MYDPNDPRRREFQSLMENSIAPLPEPAQFATPPPPMQPMQLPPMQEDSGPSPIARLGALGASLINKKRKVDDADAEDYE